jgi:hypothetical protein
MPAAKSWDRAMYFDKDPPHVAPIDGKEYADHDQAFFQQSWDFTMISMEPDIAAAKALKPNIAEEMLHYGAR